MPIVVDREAVKLQIMQAFQRCAETRPLPDISLREVAAEAGISHSKILYYFKNKNELLVSCGHWAGSSFCKTITRWFEEHKLSDYPTKLDYINDYFRYLLEDEDNNMLPRGVVMNCALGAYNDELKSAVVEEYNNIRNTFLECLRKSCGDSITPLEAEAMMVMHSGIYFCSFNEAMSGEYNSVLGTGLKNLIE